MTKNNKPPRQLKGISRITDHVVSKLLALGLDTYVSRSLKSKSRYIEIKLAKKKIIIRISDHAAEPDRRRHYRWDIYTALPRPRAISYQQFDEKIKAVIERSKA
jgi:hypothetical protein